MGVVTAINGGIAGVDALAGGYLAQNYGFASVFWTMGAVAAIAALLMIFLAPESRAEQEGADGLARAWCRWSSRSEPL